MHQYFSITRSNFQRGGVNAGMLYIIAIIAIIIGIAFIASGPFPAKGVVPEGTEVIIGEAKSEGKKDNLQLYTFSGATITPPVQDLCQKGDDNNHPEIIVSHLPPHGRGIPTDGQIKLWVSDTMPIKIAPAETIVKGSGAVKKPGDRTALAPDGYIWEPALYIFPNTVNKGGKPYFPTLIRGSYDNGAPRVSFGADPLPAADQTQMPHAVQLVWNVKDLGLTPGAYQLMFMVHDGNDGRGFGCISIRIYDPIDPEQEFGL